MTKNRHTVTLKFSKKLQKAHLLWRKNNNKIVINNKYNSVHFANDFNLRAYGTTTITRQTALKWLTGLAFPEPGHLLVITSWLELDLNEIFDSLP